MQPWKLQPARDHGLSLVDSFRSLHRENGLVAAGFHFAWWSAVRGYLKAWHRLHIHGRDHVPLQPPFILIANHTSHLDSLVLAAAVPWHLHDRLFPIAAGDVFFETSSRSALSALLLNALPLWRKKCGGHALQQLRQRLLDEACCYILFPEGTRSRDGALQPFKNGLGMLIAESNVPVVPCYLQGCFDALRPDQLWPRPRPIHVYVGQPATFQHVPNTRPGWQQIAASLEAAMKGLMPSK